MPAALADTPTMSDLAWFGVAGATLLLLAAGGGWAWWRYRVHLEEVQRRLAWTEQSRFALERHAVEVDLRLAVMSHALESLEAQRRLSGPVDPVLGDVAERRQELKGAIGRADASAAAQLAKDGPGTSTAWVDTEPQGLPPQRIEPPWGESAALPQPGRAEPEPEPYYGPYASQYAETMPVELAVEERVLPPLRKR